MEWMDQVKPEALDWLLEKNDGEPAIRYLTLRDLIGQTGQDAEMREAYNAALRTGAVAQILAQQAPEGFWVEPGPGYYPKYTSIVWTISLLAQLGMKADVGPIRKASEYLMEHARGSYGGFSMSATPGGAIHCLQGNLCAALCDLGMGNDARLQKAAEWMACSVTNDPYTDMEGTSAPIRYYRSGISGPGFLCSANDHQPCAWGAVKVALALSKIPQASRSPAMKKAIDACVEFLLSVDPATADYPHPYAPKASTSWFKFGFPVFYITDVLQILEALLGLGLSGDTRLKNAVDFVCSKQDAQGRWPMEYSYNGKMLVEFEEKKTPSKWVTLRALRVIKRYYVS